jgi:hypothetical protein
VCRKEDSNLSEDAAGELLQENGGSHYGDEGLDLLLNMFIINEIM